ncbi:hypothetical protein H9X57_15285 [Flavobacterium piscinae]|uniref:hypothetical protein n=1 Tax=Flavobacterium piscinae TaxID=2506424 RepID=UPI0019B6C596|nr:hypothetical protein [Flavobacterium piscinae]MBC8884235.1 hypothetical protein [Flavobacterium piscinae]
MKKIFFLLILFSSFVQAQIVNIPDPNFKNALLSYNPVIDTNSDGEIQESEALAVTYLILDGLDISSLEGIQSFSNLEILSCWENQLTTLDLSGMSILYSLACNDNQLINLNLSGCLNLIELFCNNNLLVELDVSGLTNLTQIICHNNLLAELDVSGHTNLEEVFFDNNPTIETFNAAGCTALISYTYHPSLKHVDFSNCTSLGNITLHTNGNLETLNVSNCQSLFFYQLINHNLPHLIFQV